MVRLKGVVGGESFNVTLGQTNWNLATAGEGSYVVLYLDERRCSVAMIEGLIDLCEESPTPARSFQLLRIDTDSAATSAEIGRLLESFAGRKPMCLLIVVSSLTQKRCNSFSRWHDVQRRLGSGSCRSIPSVSGGGCVRSSCWCRSNRLWVRRYFSLTREKLVYLLPGGRVSLRESCLAILVRQCIV